MRHSLPARMNLARMNSFGLQIGRRRTGAPSSLPGIKVAQNLKNFMFEDYITTKDEAICHLFLHCCFKDGTFSQDEIDSVSTKFVTLEIHRDLNFKEELQHYRTYQNDIQDETEFLKYLIKLITPVHDLALYSYCVELCLSDGLITSTEELLLKRIAVILEIEEEQSTIDNLMIQRKAVELEKIF